MTTDYKYAGQTFMLDDSQGCYIKVTYKNRHGFVGVSLKGTADEPYIWFPGDDYPVTPDGLPHGNSFGKTLEVNLNALCDHLIREDRLEMDRKSFEPKDACDELHKFVKTIGG